MGVWTSTQVRVGYLLCALICQWKPAVLGGRESSTALLQTPGAGAGIGAGAGTGAGARAGCLPPATGHPSRHDGYLLKGSAIGVTPCLSTLQPRSPTERSSSGLLYQPYACSWKSACSWMVWMWAELRQRSLLGNSTELGVLRFLQLPLIPVGLDLSRAL